MESRAGLSFGGPAPIAAHVRSSQRVPLPPDPARRAALSLRSPRRPDRPRRPRPAPAAPYRPPPPRPTPTPIAVTTDASAAPSDREVRPLANVAVLLAAAWIATGALYKWLAGSPNDLPPVLHGTPIGIGLLFQLVIAIELFVVVSALLLPRLGWVLVALQYVAFLVVLVTLIASGAESCGCLGSKVTMPPQVMLAIDAALLALLIASRPWRARLWSTPLLAVAAAAALALGAPWLHDRSQPTGGSGEGPGRPAFHVLEVENWEGTNALETDLASFLPDGGTTLMPGTWVVYRDSCPHCAEHLRLMKGNDPMSETITLIKIPEGLAPEAVVVDIKPEGAHVTEVTLTEGIDYVLEAPVDMRVEWEDYLLSRVREAGEIEAEGAQPFPSADPEVLRAAAAPGRTAQ